MEKKIGLLWLDLSRKCQLECIHCYNESGPTGSHGTMALADWLRVLDQAHMAGVRNVQLIGGEPTLHPDFLPILNHGLDLGLHVEVYSNAVHVSEECWGAFQHSNFSLATSYYSADPAKHDAVTQRPSHRKTRANIAKAVGLGINIRVGIVGTDTAVIEEAEQDLASIGVTNVGVDHIRPFGRGAQGAESDMSQLCGRCGSNQAAIGPDGTVTPCVFSGWMKVGNVQEGDLYGILTGGPMEEASAAIREVRGWGKKCDPDKGGGGAPKPCGPDNCVPKNPCDPRGGDTCGPGYPLSDNPARR
jgi:MoaA/NifB/PqqE/SkfB family radical SAM enzyme